MLLQNKKPTLQKGQKDEVPCWLNSETKLAAYIFLLHHFGLQLFHFLVLLIRVLL